MHNTYFITISGLFGGMTKAISSGIILSSITLPHILEIAFYAAISAVIGYVVKLSIDNLRQFIINPKKSKKR